MKRLLSLFATASLVGCGSCDSTGPVNANLTGSWTYSVTNLAGGGYSCNSSGTTLVITQSGASFTGTYSGGTFSCSYQGTSSATSPVGSGVLASGTVSGNNVSFNFDPLPWSNTGTI